MEKEEFPVVMCIYGEGEVCSPICPIFETCWPKVKDKDKELK